MKQASVAILVAVLGVALGSVSLAWQVATWALSAGRLKVTLVIGVQAGTGIVSSPISKNGRPRTNILQDGRFRGPPLLAVQVANVGRGPVTVTGYGAKDTGYGLKLQLVADAIGPPLPHRLEPGEGGMWAMPLASAEVLAHNSDLLKKPTGGVEMWVATATGKTYTTAAAIRL